MVLANPNGAGLPGTEEAAAILSTHFSDTQSLIGDTATEARLRGHARPRLLHVGTHGFFESSSSHGDPMLQSGLILADTHQPQVQEGSDDGLLTAAELATFDLRGTELVALSACNSGRGAEDLNEGTLGLREALVLAGAQTQVVGLWRLPDRATAVLWNAYYPRLAAGEGRGEAMRQAQLELLRTNDYRHPRDWAAFVVFGEWGPLSGMPIGNPSIDGPPPVVHPHGCQATIGVPTNGTPAGLILFCLAGLLRCRRSRHLGNQATPRIGVAPSHCRGLGLSLPRQP